MKNKNNSKHIICGIVGMAVVALAANYSHAQIIAYDAATNSIYSGSFSGLNGGFGFGAWNISTPGGGSYVGGGYFGLWNNATLPGNYSQATRTFDSALTVGDSFTTSYLNQTLNGSSEWEGFRLLDSSGNVLFGYWQQGGNGSDGNYLDAGGAGIATGFAYNFNTVNSYQFTLTSSSTYTFTDLSTSASFDGILSGTVDQVQYFRESLAGDPNNGGGGGTDFRFFDMQITATPVPEPSIFALAGMGGMGILLMARRRLSEL